jgi:hypothetical protein
MGQPARLDLTSRRSSWRGEDDADVKRGAELLASWDHMEREGSPGPLLVERWVRAMMVRMFGHLVDPLMLADRKVHRFLIDPLLYALEGEGAIVPLRYDYARGKDLKAMALEAFREAIKGGEEKLAWKEPSVDFRGEVGNVRSKKERGSCQMVVEMTPRGPRAATVAAPGQSERPDSRHYKDQVGLFEKWEYKPFVWRREEMK